MPQSTQRATIGLKFWFFKHYWWVLGLIMAGAGIFIACRGVEMSAALAILGGGFSLIFFVQKQKLEELCLFREVFKDFNERYNVMNGHLAKVTMAVDGELTEEERGHLIDYFNLCGEEYLYYKKGYIDPEVWKAWEKGMRAVLHHPRVQPVWARERETGTYYGLPL